MTYDPTLTIDGVVISGSWDGSILVALDGLSINWGRENLFDETLPTTLSVSILDPTGSWATANSLIGVPVTLDRADPTTRQFRGRVSDVDIVPKKVQNPITGQIDQVWIASLLCTDVLTDLSQAITGGPGAPGGGVAVGAWAARTTPSARIADIFTMGAAQFVSDIEIPVPTPVPGETAWVKSHPATLPISFLELIQRLYKYIPLARANYNPRTHAIEIGLPASNDGSTLSIAAGLMTIAPVSAHLIPASNVELTAELVLSSNVSSAIDIVQLNWLQWGPDHPSGINTVVTAQAFTSRFSPAQLGSRLLSVDSDIFYVEQHAINVVSATADLVDEVNSRFSVPDGLRIDFRKSEFDPEISDVLLDTCTREESLFFGGSILNPLPNVGPMFQLIGGVLTWHNSTPGNPLPPGWVLDMKLAPTTGDLENVSMVDLVTNTTPAMDSFDPAISMIELGTITEGLS